MTTEPYEYDPEHLFRAAVEPRRPDTAVSTAHGVGNVAFAALALTLGCPAQKVGELHRRMWNAGLPATPQDAIDQFEHHIRLMEGE